MADIAYVRVSTEEQNTARQEFPGVQLRKTFTDIASGSRNDRAGLAAALDFLREGDTLHVHSIDRLARDLRHLQEIVDDLTRRGVTVYFHREQMVFRGEGQGDAMNRLMLQMIGAFAEFERARIRERQAEGIAKAKMRGVYKGGKPSVDREAIRRALEEGMSYRKAAKHCGVSVSTVQRVAKGSGSYTPNGVTP